MKWDINALRLYLVTDRKWLDGRRLTDVVEQAIRAGVTLVQLREKSLSERAFLEQARALRALTAAYHVPLIINDNVPIAYMADADGVHIGQSDMAVESARRILGENRIIGVSAHTPALARAAEKAGADYIGIGAVFGSTTKTDADTVSLDTVREICAAVSVPAVAIGGIGTHNAGCLAGLGLHGISVISAILASDDIPGTTAQLRALAEAVAK